MSRHQIVVDAGSYRCTCGDGSWATSYAWACHAVGFSAETLARLLIERAEPLLASPTLQDNDAPDTQEVPVLLGALRQLKDAIDVTGALVRSPRT
jgi:hypothetical protein